MTYAPHAIEPRWQAYWDENRTFRAEIDPAKPKFYALDMFPYPSGAGLHVGHPAGYTATDIICRQRRMAGWNVLHPMGWDAFGLPAERYAMRTGIHPAVTTRRNIATFRGQVRRLGFSYDWDREVATTDPGFMRWTQWIFLKLVERGLAYQAEVAVNWCPAQNTVLANEEVKDGRYVETGDPVVQRPMRQWMLRITAYAERLLADLDGLDWPEGIKALQRHWIGRTEEMGSDGRPRITYRLRDWLFSRQRYWGEPIPMLHLADGRAVPLPEDSLPLLPPELDDYAPAEGGDPPLARARGWVETTVPGTDIPARRETNTMPQWAGSSWYYLRFLDPHNDREIVGRDAERYWMPVDLYVGGAEHGVLHLLYARFWHKVLYDIGVVSTPEPFQRLFNQGMILAPSYRDAAGRYVDPSQVEDPDGQPHAAGVPLVRQVEKMSKSRFNVINPDAVVAEHGADGMRLYEMFMGPLDAAKPWAMSGLVGIRRFLDRAWRIVCDDDDGLSPAVQPMDAPPALLRLHHATVAAVTADIEALRFNTAIARLMELAQALAAAMPRPRALVQDFVLLLAPFAPHIAEELWAKLGHDGSLAHTPWPGFDPDLAKALTTEYAVQLDGRTRHRFPAPAGLDAPALIAAARADPAVAALLAGRTVVREITVPGRLVNFVTRAGDRDP